MIVECRLSPELTRKRLLQRLGEVSASDGRWETYERQLNWFQRVKNAAPEHYALIDTSEPVAQNIRRILDRID